MIVYALKESTLSVTIFAKIVDPIAITVQVMVNVFHARHHFSFKTEVVPAILTQFNHEITVYVKMGIIRTQITHAYHVLSIVLHVFRLPHALPAMEICCLFIINAFAQISMLYTTLKPASVNVQLAIIVKALNV